MWQNPNKAVKYGFLSIALDGAIKYIEENNTILTKRGTAYGENKI